MSALLMILPGIVTIDGAFFVAILFLNQH